MIDLGRMGYRPAWDRQLEVSEQVASGGPDTLLLVEHNPVFTLGAAFQPENLLHSVSEIESRGFEVVRTDRGGDVTYHGPGQLTIYPIFDVSRHGRDLHRWMRDLEETQLLVLAEFGLKGRRFAPHTGAWVNDEKVAAIGVKIRRWISLHGIAINADLDLAPFRLIVPCGIRDHGVTSVSRLVGSPVTVDDMKPRVVQAFQDVFFSER